MTKKRFAGRIRFRSVLLLWLTPLLCFFLCLCLGRMAIAPGDVFSSLFSGIFPGASVSSQIRTVILSIRIPRLLLAAACGIGLSVSGCAFQSLFSNPLATPDTLGAASGASFGAVLGLLLGAGLMGVQLMALVFGLLAVLFTGLSGKGLGDSKNTPILAGIMVGSLFNALISLVKFTADTESQLPAITYWLMGSMESAGYESLLVGLPPILLCTAILLLLRWRMNLLPLSEDEATSLGGNSKLLRAVTQLCATMITASCVSMCGQVGWVGLLVPHICRMKTGSNHVSLLPACVSVGAVFMMLVDTVARTVSPKEIPLSVLTAIIGAPFFVFLLRKNRRLGL